MLYLIMSSAMKEDENGNLEYFRILKIGYTEDKNKDKRFDAYFLHNPTCKILKIIPNATPEQESKVKFKFKDLLFARQEWFLYDQSIIDFFNNIKSLEELDKLPNPILRHEKKAITKLKKRIKPILGYIFLTKKEINDYFYKLLSVFGDNLDEDNTIKYLQKEGYDVSKYINYKKLKDTGNFSDNEEINNHVSDLISIYDTLKSPFDRLKLVIDYYFSGDSDKKEAIEIFIHQLSDSDYVKMYYTNLGPNRIKALSCNVTLLKKEMGIVIFDQSKLEKEIYSNFKEGDRIILSNLKSKLAVIYDSIGYEKSPKAIDIQFYFNVKEYMETVIVEGKKKRVRGYELIKKLR